MWSDRSGLPETPWSGPLPGLHEVPEFQFFAQVTNISDDQQRVRENMKALKGSAEEKALIERYVRELNEQEDRSLENQETSQQNIQTLCRE